MAIVKLCDVIDLIALADAPKVLRTLKAILDILVTTYLSVQFLHAHQIYRLQAVAVWGYEVETGVYARVMEAEKSNHLKM